MEKRICLITGATDGVAKSDDSSRTVAARKRALNGAILSGQISRGYEEYLENFDRFYAEDIQATTETLKEPDAGKAAVRAGARRFGTPL
jgi:hypothetical protein